jgi:ZIP family zinc transporter
MLEAFGWGLLAAGSLVLGAFIASVRDIHGRQLGIVMAFGAGVLLSAVSFDLVDDALDLSEGAGGTVAGVLLGAVAFTVGDQLISRRGYGKRKDIDAAPADASGTAIALGALLDGVPETAVLGLVLLQTGEIGIALLVAVFVSNVPEAIAASASLRNGGWSRSRIYALWSTIAVLSAMAAALGYQFLDGASPDVIAAIYGFAAGAILTMLATSMMPEAFDHADYVAGVATVLGFVVAFTLSWMQG